MGAKINHERQRRNQGHGFGTERRGDKGTYDHSSGPSAGDHVAGSRQQRTTATAAITTDTSTARRAAGTNASCPPSRRLANAKKPTSAHDHHVGRRLAAIMAKGIIR